MKRHPRNSELFHLDLAPMAAIFMMIIAVLLKIFILAEETPVAQNQGMTIPSLEVAEAETVKVISDFRVIISKQAVLIDGKEIKTLIDGKLRSNEKSSHGGLAVLDEYLRKIEVDASRSIAMVADKDIPYDTLKTVISSLTNKGLKKIQLVHLPNTSGIKGGK